MPRNRIIYNVEGLFVGPYSGEQNIFTDYYLTGYQILKRIEKVQSINYGIDENRINLAGFGSKKNIFRGLAAQPSVNLTFNYIPDGFTNENRLNFDIAHFQSSIQPPMFSGICRDDSLKDKKDFYIVVNNADQDLFVNDYILNSLSINPTSVNNVIDPNSKDYSILHFQNCYLNNYSFDLSVGDLPNVTQSYIADNIIYYISGSGVSYTTLNLSSGNLITGSEKLIIPRYTSLTGSNISGQNILVPGAAQVIFSTQNTTGILFYTDVLQKLNLNVSFERKNLRSLNYKFPLSKTINFPVNCNLDMSFIVEESLSGSFFDTLNRDQDYNILVNFNSSFSRRGVYPSRFLFSGVRFNNINYDSSIGSNKAATLSFNFDLDPDFGRRGIFASGNVLYGILNNQKKVLIF
jgi:hypothetical protein